MTGTLLSIMKDSTQHNHWLTWLFPPKKHHLRFWRFESHQPLRVKIGLNNLKSKLIKNIPLGFGMYLHSWQSLKYVSSQMNITFLAFPKVSLRSNLNQHKFSHCGHEEPQHSSDMYFQWHVRVWSCLDFGKHALNVFSRILHVSLG